MSHLSASDRQNDYSPRVILPLAERARIAAPYAEDEDVHDVLSALLEIGFPADQAVAVAEQMKKSD